MTAWPLRAGFSAIAQAALCRIPRSRIHCLSKYRAPKVNLKKKTLKITLTTYSL